MTQPTFDGLVMPQLRKCVEINEARITDLQDAGRIELIERLTREAESLGFDSRETLIDRRRRTKRGRGNGAAHAAD